MQTLQQYHLAEWINAAINGVVLLLFLAGLAVAAWRLYREKKGAAQAELKRLDKARKTLTTLMNGAVCGFVTEAENTYGAGTGSIKKSAVLAELVKLLPEEYRSMFDADLLGTLIENGLNAAKKIWNK